MEARIGQVIEITVEGNAHHDLIFPQAQTVHVVGRIEDVEIFEIEYVQLAREQWRVVVGVRHGAGRVKVVCHQVDKVHIFTVSVGALHFVWPTTTCLVQSFIFNLKSLT